ncbi:DAHL domain-containing protein [Pseudomonas palleroniana]
MAVYIAASVAAIAFLVFVYFKVNSIDGSKYSDFRDYIRQLKQLDAGWNMKIITVSPVKDSNVSLAMPPDLNAHWEGIEGLVGAGDLSVLLENRRQKYNDVIQSKQRLVEQFKEHDAKLRESLKNLSGLESAVDQLLTHSGERLSRDFLTILLNVIKLKLATLDYVVSNSEASAGEFKLLLEAVEGSLNKLSDADQQLLEPFIVNMRGVLQEQPVVSDLVERIGFIPVTQTLDSLTELLNESQRRSQSLNLTYQRALLLCAGIMAILLMYLLLRLNRSYEVIHRVNADLQTANESLEQRVEERTRELVEAEKELVESARMAGMAEIANNVLHNVGNVLNSVNVSAELITRKVATSKTLGLGRAVRLMEEHIHDIGHFFEVDEKGKLIPSYLIQVVEAVAVEQAAIAEELIHITNSIDHIKDIVSTQQAYAGAARFVEALDVKDILEDALRINSNAFARHNIVVSKSVTPLGLIMGDKHRLLLILINLISNAVHAMCNVVDRQRELTLSVDLVADSKLQFIVKDVGEGILQENLLKIFAHGFTTRKDGHGFGLHSCALAAVEMNGKLTVASDGRGLGAVFTLEIPFEAVAS